MENLIGDDILRAPALLAEPGLVLHLYGKTEARPGRKMGHFDAARSGGKHGAFAAPRLTPTCLLVYEPRQHCGALSSAPFILARWAIRRARPMKIKNSLKALKARHRDNQLVRRKGRVYIINKTARATRRARAEPTRAGFARPSREIQFDDHDCGTSFPQCGIFLPLQL